MKKNLGRFLLLFIPIFLFSSPLADLSFKLSSDEPFVNEPITLTLTAKQKDLSSAIFFEFIKPTSKDYEITLINKIQNRDENQAKTVTFRYKILPKKSGEIKIPLTLKVKQASKDSVMAFNTGSADELENLKTKDTLLDLNPIHLKVKELKKKVDFIGDFELTYKIDKTKAEAYEPIYASFDIKGVGSHNDIKKLFDDIKGVEIFLDKRGDLGFDYVFVSNKSFSIKPIKLSCYSPSKKRYYTLKSKKIDVTIEKIDSTSLLDKSDSYPSSGFDIDKVLPYLNAILLFLAGYLSSHFDLFKKVQKVQKNDDFKDKIKECKDEKELLKLLLSQNQKRYTPFIEELEDMIYRSKSGSIRSIKDRLSDL
jgi:hypothetical protein